MALRTLALAAVTVAVLPWSNGAALAFDRGCGRAVECYDRVRVPDTYATVERPVIVRPGFREVVQMPPVVSVRHERVVVAPARVHTVREPALYATAIQRVEVAPAQVHYAVAPPVIRTISG